MTVKRVADSTGGIRTFRTTLPSGLVEMREKGFDDEKQMQRFVEYNIGTLFPGLEFIKTEFGEISGGLFRPDTIAFDTNERTFVVIEYKNKSKRKSAKSGQDISELHETEPLRSQNGL